MKLLDEDRLPKDHYQVFKSLTNYSYVNKEALYKELKLSLNSRRLHKHMDRLCTIEDFRNKVRQKKDCCNDQPQPPQGKLIDAKQFFFHSVICSD